MIMEVVPEGVDQINGAVTCIRFGMPWFQDKCNVSNVITCSGTSSLQFSRRFLVAE